MTSLPGLPKSLTKKKTKQEKKVSGYVLISFAVFYTFLLLSMLAVCDTTHCLKVKLFSPSLLQSNHSTALRNEKCEECTFKSQTGYSSPKQTCLSCSGRGLCNVNDLWILSLQRRYFHLKESVFWSNGHTSLLCLQNKTKTQKRLIFWREDLKGEVCQISEQ